MTACPCASPASQAPGSKSQINSSSRVPDDRRFAIRLPPSLAGLAQLLTMGETLASGNFVAKKRHAPLRRLSHVRQRCSLSNTNRDIVPRAVIQASKARLKHGLRTRRTMMSFAIQHVHVKTKDPKQTMQFYIDNLGATYVAEIPGRGHRVNLHGLTLNITTLISAQNHEQHYGIEHIALDTDDYSGAMSKLRENGVRVLEELPPNNGRRVCFLEAPDGAQIELIEKVQPA